MGSVSGALQRHIAAWTRTIAADRLQFFALHLPTSTWTQLADVCHLNADKVSYHAHMLCSCALQDFPQLPWFLRYCYNKSAAPADTLPFKCAGMTAENANEFVMVSVVVELVFDMCTQAHDVPYAHVKALGAKLDTGAKVRIAKYTKLLDTLLWSVDEQCVHAYSVVFRDYEDLKCQEVDAVITTRLRAGEPVTLPYGKLMERLLMLRKQNAPFYKMLLPYAERMLKQIS